MQTCHQLLRFVGLTLRHHSVSFLRGDLAQRRIVACAKPMASRDGRWLEAAGIILMRQMHGRPKDSCSSRSKPRRASPILWFGRRCSSRTGRTILSAGMLGIRGRIQRAGEVVHLVAHQLTDLSAALAGVGRFRMAAARRSTTAAPVPIRVNSQRAACARETSTTPMATSTKSK